MIIRMGIKGKGKGLWVGGLLVRERDMGRDGIEVG